MSGWTRIGQGSAEAPESRQQSLLAAFAAQDALILFGGETSGGRPLQDAWRFDVSSGSWTELEPSSSTTIEPRFSFNGGLDEAGERLIVFGGEGNNGAVFNDVWAFSLTTQTWTQLLNGSEAGAPKPRYGAAGGVVNIGGEAYLIVSHGFDKKDRFKDTFLLRLSTSTWTNITPDSDPLPSARCLVAGAVSQQSQEITLALAGGCGSGGYGPCPSSETFLFRADLASLEDAQWEGPLPTCVNARNYGSMAADASGNFFMYGGWGGLLVDQDEPGQINQFMLNPSGVDPIWNQFAIDGEGPGMPTGNGRQSSMATFGGAVFLQLASTNELWILNYTTADFSNLLECNSDPIPSWRTSHGVLMVLAWGVLIPLAVLMARFGRIKDPLWFKVHRAFNTLGIVLGFVGIIVAFLMISAGHFLAVGHALIGVLVTLLGVQQVNAFCRPHAPADPALKSKSRNRWELWHKNSGRLALILGLVNPFIGLSFLVNFSSAAFIIYTLWVAFLVAVFVYLTSHGLPTRSNLAIKVNQNLCRCLASWDDSFQEKTPVNK